MFLGIENLSKIFYKTKNPFVAFENINLSIKKGEFLCILGPSGCGKTTLFNIIAGLDRPTGGRVNFRGEEVKKPGADRAVVFQDGALFPWLTVYQNIEFGIKKLYKNKGERRERVEHYLAMVRLQEFSDSYIHELSGGMKQRVAIARALALESEVLLMDEPFSALDDYNRTLLQNELLRIWNGTGKTILFITHNIQEALFLGDRVLVMSDSPGRFVREFEMSKGIEKDMESQEILSFYEEAKKILGASEDEEGKERVEFTKDSKKSNVLSNLDSFVGVSL